MIRLVDPNMDTALVWAGEVGPVPLLPHSLDNASSRASLVDAVDPIFAGGLLEIKSAAEKDHVLKSLATVSKERIPELVDDKARVNVCLRLWSGCVSAAKTIAPRTLDGANTPDGRTRLFRMKIDALARIDPIYCAGVEAAPAFRGLRKQQWSFDGVPADSPVRRYA
jgi:hypothetical protein